jgi:HPC2 and ubinuclein domain
MNENSLDAALLLRFYLLRDVFIISQGTGSAYSKASKLTTVDRGAGYDASDSFIDDTEAVSVGAEYS